MDLKIKKNKQKRSFKEAISDFFDGYRTLPDTIKTKCILYILLSIGGIVGIVVSAVALKSLMAVTPFLGMVCLGIVLFYSNVSNHIKGKILILEGDCYAVELSPMKTNAQKVYFQHNGTNICLRLKEKYKKIQKGDHLVVYILDSTPMYEDRDIYIINNYIAAQITSTINETENETAGGKLQNIIRFNKK